MCVIYTGKVDICGVDTSKLPRLKDSETAELLKKARGGDKNAREALINGNLRLVLSVVKRFVSRGENPDDLFQVGCIGLIKAIDNFDLSLNVCFSTYGVPMILGEIRRYLRDNSMLRVSRAMRDTAYRALAVREKMTAENAREPTVDEIAKQIGADPFDVVQSLEAIVDPASLYEPVYSDGGDAIYVMDQVKSGDCDDNWLDEILIKEAMKSLPPREREIVSLRFMDGKTQMEVAREIGISQAQVSRLEKGALARIKSSL